MKLYQKTNHVPFVNLVAKKSFVIIYILLMYLQMRLFISKHTPIVLSFYFISVGFNCKLVFLIHEYGKIYFCAKIELESKHETLNVIFSKKTFCTF